MKIQFMGTGPGLGVMGNTAFVIDDRILVDCGNTVPAALKEYELTEKITDIFITHLHGDHVGGLEMLGFYSYFVMKKRIRLHVPADLLEPLWENCMKGYMEHIQSPHGAPLTATLDTFYDVVQPLGGEPFSAPYGFFFKPAWHVPNKSCYGLEWCELSSYLELKPKVFYSGDAARLDSIALRDNHDLIIHDAAPYDAGEGAVHIHVNKLAKQMTEEQRAKTWIVHYGDTPLEDLGFAGVAEKGQVIEL